MGLILSRFGAAPKVRVVVLGSSGAGKTCLTLTLSTGKMPEHLMSGGMLNVSTVVYQGNGKEEAGRQEGKHGGMVAGWQGGSGERTAFRSFEYEGSTVEYELYDMGATGTANVGELL